MAEYDTPRPVSQPLQSTDLAVAKDNLITLDRVINGSNGLPVSNRKGADLQSLETMLSSIASDVGVVNGVAENAIIEIGETVNTVEAGKVQALADMSTEVGLTTDGKTQALIDIAAEVVLTADAKELALDEIAANVIAANVGVTIAFFSQGLLIGGESSTYVASAPFRILDDLPDTQGWAGTTATASNVIDIEVNGVKFGDVTFAVGSNVGTVSATAGFIDVSKGDRVTVVNQAIADLTIANVSISIQGVFL